MVSAQSLKLRIASVLVQVTNLLPVTVVTTPPVSVQATLTFAPLNPVSAKVTDSRRMAIVGQLELDAGENAIIERSGSLAVPEPIKPGAPSTMTSKV